MTVQARFDAAQRIIRRSEASIAEAQARAAELHARLQSGETVAEIARSVGVSRQRIDQLLRRYGYPTRIPKICRNVSVITPRSRALLRILSVLDANVKVGAKEDCWPWIGAVQVMNERTGYVMPGTINAFDPLCASECRSTLPYRVVFMLHKGPIPEGMTVDHICFNPLCCNPDHLQLLTRAENAARRNPERLARNRAAGIYSRPRKPQPPQEAAS